MSAPKAGLGALPLGVCVLPEQSLNCAHPIEYPGYLYEILDHAGVCYECVALEELGEHLANLRLLVTIGEHELGTAAKGQMRQWVEAGGCWLSIGGICGMADVLGAEHRPPAYPNWHGGLTLTGEGYLVAPDPQHPALNHLSQPLHFFGGLDVRQTSAEVIALAQDAHGREQDQPVLLEHTFGKGRSMLLAVDVTHTIVRIQQGVAVTRDGVPAPGGTAPICDGVLKSDDGHVVDWIFDRQPVPGVPGLSGFLEPIADLWRELLLRCIFHLASARRLALPLLWLYPRKVPALGHISHDTDLNDPVGAEALLRTLAEAQIHSTWCTILPGYDRNLTDKIRAAGHELAMHYDAMSEGRRWSEAEFDRQFNELTQLFSGERPTTNKNHYLRWEGDSELWDWSVKRGIKLDQTKGPSKTGAVGFNFGTCHPYQPIRFSGELIAVLELPTPTQDLVVFVPEVVLEPLLTSVKKCHGILHLLFHPAHVDKPGVANAILNAVRRGRREGLEWWTARQIHEWEYARRSLRWLGYSDGDGAPSASVRCNATLNDATILWLRADKMKSSRAQAMRAWGFDFDATTLTLDVDQECTVGLGGRQDR